MDMHRILRSNFGFAMLIAVLFALAGMWGHGLQGAAQYGFYGLLFGGLMKYLM